MSRAIPVNSKILTWAREELNLTIEEVAMKIKKDPATIRNWENGSSSPTYCQLEKLSYNVYKVPLAVFFFSEPPESPKTKSSFRTAPDVILDKIPSTVLEVFREAEVMIENLYELNEGSNILSNQKNLLRDVTFSDISNTAISLRSFLGISIDEQKSWGSSEHALKVWRNKITESGIFIFKKAFRNNDYSGFCLYDERFPVIYLNSSTTKNRQIFTIFHELWHLLLRANGIESDRVIYYHDHPLSIVEIQCNEFASEFLFPTSEFEQIILQRGADEKTFSDLSIEFSVSKEVILRRFLDYGSGVTQDEYDQLTAKWNKELQRDKKPIRGSFYSNEMSRLGDSYLKIAFNAYYGNRITPSQLANYLNTKEKTLSDYEANYLKRVKV